MITPLILSMFFSYLGGYWYILAGIFFIDSLGRIKDFIDIFNHIYQVDRNIRKYQRTHCQRQALWLCYRIFYPEQLPYITSQLEDMGYYWWYKRHWIVLKPSFLRKFIGL